MTFDFVAYAFPHLQDNLYQSSCIAIDNGVRTPNAADDN